MSSSRTEFPRPGATLIPYRFAREGGLCRDPLFQSWLERLTERAVRGEAISVRLARDGMTALGGSGWAVAVEQVDLRRRGRAKFGEMAWQMLFERELLEQATDLRVSGYKAARFPIGKGVVDFCCGLGGDGISLASRGLALLIDRSPSACALAKHNLGVFGKTSASSGYPPPLCVQSEMETPTLGKRDYWHLDPDRRALGVRATGWHGMSPSLEATRRLLAQAPNAAIKLAPSATPRDEWENVAEWEWISDRRECRQLVAWFGDLAKAPGQRVATVVSGRHASTFLGRPRYKLTRPVESVGDWLLEPFPALFAAHLTEEWAADLGVAPVTAGGGYFTCAGEQPKLDGLAQVFEVVDRLPMDRRKIKAAIRALGWSRLEIKQRGAGWNIAECQREWRCEGEGEGVALLTRGESKSMAILARRVQDAVSQLPDGPTS